MANGTRRAWETRGEEQEFFFFSLGRKPPFDYRHRVVLDDVTVLHSPLTTFLSFFPSSSSSSYLVSGRTGYTTHFLAPPPPSLPYFLRYPALPILSFRSSIANNSPLPPLRAFMIRRGEKSAWNGTRNPLGEEFYRVEGKVFSVRHLSFFFF